MRRLPARTFTALIALAALFVVLPGAASVEAVDLDPAAVMASADLTRPRILMDAADLPAVRARLGREPYRSLLGSVRARAEGAPPPNAADQADCVQTANVAREMLKARASFDLSVLYLFERTTDPVTGDVVPLVGAEREAVGDLARDYLLAMCRESRIKVFTDRDISTSHELLSSAMAYDNLLGGGYDFGANGASVVDNLTTLAGEFYSHYNQPASPNVWIMGATKFAVNNHRSKGSTALGAAGIVLHDYEAPAGTDPSGWKDPAAWLDFGLERTDRVLRWTYGAGDGAYGEGPHYARFTLENLVPFASAWDRISGGATVTTAAGAEVPSLWRHPQFRRFQRWLLDQALPDGTGAPIDDAKSDESGLHGVFGPTAQDPGAERWRWETSRTPYATEGNIDLAAFSIVAFDDSIPPSLPAGSPTAFYVEGGNAMFRSSWGTDAFFVLAQAEHGAAREFGLERDGTGEKWSAAHDHADPGAFLLHAFGERLVIDPGYVDFSWSRHFLINKPADHTMVLVDALDQPRSPIDPFKASAHSAPAALWAITSGSPTPADGHASWASTLDGASFDAGTAVARYGLPAADAALVERRFVTVDDRFLVVADDVTSSAPRTLTWPVHGNAGGSDHTFPGAPARSLAASPPNGAGAIPPTPVEASGGTFTELDAGATWERADARLTVGLDTDVGDPTMSSGVGYHERARNAVGEHAVRYGTVDGDDVHALSVYYPTPTAAAAPSIERLEVPRAAALRLVDPATGTTTVLVHRRAGAGMLDLPASVTGSVALHTDGSLVVLEGTAGGEVRSVYAENATVLAAGDATLRMGEPAVLGLARPDGLDGRLELTGLPGTGPAGEPDLAIGGRTVADPVLVVEVGDGSASLAHGCAVDGPVEGVRLVHPGRDGLATLHPDPAGGGAPSADAGADRRVATGTVVTLDGRASCDPDGDELTPRWELVSAPPGSDWDLRGVDTWQPTMTIDVPGPHRARLVVTDDTGAVSRTAEVTVVGGTPANDGMDNDLDGRFDAADGDGEPDRAVVSPPPPPTLPTTTTTTTSSSTSNTSTSTTSSTPTPSTTAVAAAPPVGPTAPASGGGPSTPDGLAASAASAPTSGKLPLTGISLLLGGIGLALVLAGAMTLAVRRRLHRI